jgi:hypothetical protein
MRRLAFLLVFVPTYALAEPSSSSDPKKMRTDDCARARKLGKTCVIDMPAEVLEEGVAKPDGIGIDARDFADHKSLVRIRWDFIAEILKSANDID